MLLERRAAGDRRRAKQLIDEAASEASTLGLTDLRKRLDVLRAAALDAADLSLAHCEPHVPTTTHKTGLRLLGPGGEEFVVREQLALRGQGPLGDVHRAEGITSGHQAEVKFLPSYPLAHSRAAVLNEIEMARKVQHSNVLAVLHIAPDQRDPPGPYLMTEHTSEGSLQDEIHRRKRDAAPFDLASPLHAGRRPRARSSWFPGADGIS